MKEYNHLNLPKSIIFQSGNRIDYTYDAGGKKLTSARSLNGTSVDKQQYLDGIEYKDNAGIYRLEAIYHPEDDRLVSSARRESSERFHSIKRELRPTGSQLERAICNPSTTAIALRHELCIKDHLGNTRLTFTDKNNNGQIDVTPSSSTNEILQVTERSQRVKGA